MPRIRTGQLGKGVVQRDHVPLLPAGDGQALIEMHHPDLSAALACKAGARMVHEHLTHRFGSHSKKMVAILPVPFRSIDQLQIRFVNYGGGLQRVAGVLPPHVTPGPLT